MVKRRSDEVSEAAERRTTPARECGCGVDGRAWEDMERGRTEPWQETRDTAGCFPFSAAHRELGARTSEAVGTGRLVSQAPGA